MHKESYIHKKVFPKAYTVEKKGAHASRIQLGVDAVTPASALSFFRSSCESLGLSRVVVTAHVRETLTRYFEAFVQRQASGATTLEQHDWAALGAVLMDFRNLLQVFDLAKVPLYSNYIFYTGMRFGYDDVQATSTPRT